VLVTKWLFSIDNALMLYKLNINTSDFVRYHLKIKIKILLSTFITIYMISEQINGKIFKLWPFTWKNGHSTYGIDGETIANDIGITWRFAKFLQHHQIIYTECMTAIFCRAKLPSCTSCK